MWRISVPQEGQPQGVRAAGITGRRRFLRGSLLAGVGALGVAAVGSIVRLLDSMDQPLEADALHVAAHAIPRPGADPLYFPNERFYLVNLLPNEGSGAITLDCNGICEASEAPRDGLLALNHACTHLGCPVRWRTDFAFEGRTDWFRCPCHDATYTKAGQRVFGPAPRSMDTVPLSWHHDGSVTVYWKQLRRGGPDDPDRAQPRSG